MCVLKNQEHFAVKLHCTLYLNHKNAHLYFRFKDGV